jgi:hypothetical protein
MKKNNILYIASTISAVQTTTYAGIRWESEPEDDDGEGIPDWLAYLILMFFAVAIFRKKK